MPSMCIEPGPAPTCMGNVGTMVQLFTRAGEHVQMEGGGEISKIASGCSYTCRKGLSVPAWVTLPELELALVDAVDRSNHLPCP